MPYKDPTSPAAIASRRRISKRQWLKVKGDAGLLDKKRATGRRYAAEHADEAAARFAEWAPKNRDKLNAASGRYREAHRKQITEHTMELYRTSDEFRLKMVLRTRLRAALKNGQKTGSAVRDLGCTIPELKAYLEAKFQPGMAWENWSPKGWHIDHIRPLASFDLMDRGQFLKACHYTNLQPLWAEENLKKGAKS